MKKLASIAAVTAALFSGAAFAERGADQLNQIEPPTSTAHDSHDDITLSPSYLTELNGGDAKNRVLETSTQDAATVAGHYAPAELTRVNS